jgi:hypothetical protein
VALVPNQDDCTGDSAGLGLLLDDAVNRFECRCPVGRRDRARVGRPIESTGKRSPLTEPPLAQDTRLLEVRNGVAPDSRPIFWISRMKGAALDVSSVTLRFRDSWKRLKVMCPKTLSLGSRLAWRRI